MISVEEFINIVERDDTCLSVDCCDCPIMNECHEMLSSANRVLALTATLKSKVILAAL